MNSFVETLNHLGGIFLSFAWPMFWQSGLLIAVMFAFDFLCRRKIRASVRYALWLVVLVKLCVPPTLALPTSPAWWLHKIPPPAVMKPAAHYTVTYDNLPLPQLPLPAFVPPKPVMNLAVWLLAISFSISSGLFLWLLVRWRQIARQVHRAKTSKRLAALADETQKLVGIKFKVQVKLTTNSMSPAVCGLFRPAILIPQSLVDNFSDEQLRAVLLHELIHLRRRDVWVNFLQALLQIFYWWHPLVWLANARIRRVREEAVDDTVMLALRDEAESYAPTLLEVAKLALNRPLASLGLVGILESRHALRQRIERLVDFRPPRKAGLTLVSLLGILAFTAVAVPMGGAPAETNNPILPANFFSRTNAAQEPVMVTFKINHPIRLDDLRKLFLDAGVKIPPTIFFYQDNGILLARGSREQLALVNQLVLKLNGYSPKEIETDDKQFTKRMGTLGFVNPAATNLYTRTLKVDKIVFITALQKATGLQTTNVSVMAGNFFNRLGVDWESPEGKSIFYNDHLSMLFVKATAPDLDIIERAIEALETVAPQIHIKARFVAVMRDDSKPLGIGWYLRHFGTNDVVSKGAISPPFTTGAEILSEPTFRVEMHALEKRPGFEQLAEPEAVTTSGRQTQMRATTVMTVVTNFAFRENGTNESIIPQQETIELGPILDVVPYVLSDSYTINLTAIPSLTEFLGYDKTTNSAIVLNKAGEKIQMPTILPRFDVRQSVATFNIWDGQTVVLGKLNDEIIVGGEK